MCRRRANGVPLKRSWNMNRKCIVVLIAVAAFALPACHKQVKTRANVTRATITLVSGPTPTCVQKVGGRDLPYPPLTKSRLDSIQWEGPTAATAPRVAFQRAVPFQQTTFDSGQNSGAPVNGAPGTDYDFQSVSVFDPSDKQWKSCTITPHSMGVHIN